MKYEIKEISSIKRKIEVELTPEEFDNYYAEALREFVSETEMPGFRKGKAPEKLVEGKINPADVLSHAAEHAIRDNWFKVLKESKIEAVSQPQVEIVKVAKGNPFVFNAEIEILPEIKLPDLKSITNSLTKEEIKVEEKDIEETLNWLRQTRSKTSEKEGPVEKGDLVEITFYSPTLEDDQEKKDRFIVDKGHYIKGLEEALVGMKANEEKEFETTGPKEEKLQIHLRLDAIKKVELPEINDEWAKSLGSFENLNSLKEDIKKGIKEEKELALKQKQREEALKLILNKTKFEAPQSMIEREEGILLDNLKSRIGEELRISFEEYLTQIKKTEEDVKSEFKKIAEERVKGFLVLHQISKSENIEVKEEEISAKIEEILNQYPNKEEARKNMNLEQSKMYIEDELKREKIFNLLGC